MFAENRKISLRQLQVLLLLDCFGTAVLFLPAELAQVSGKACWLAAFFGGLVFTGLSFLLAYVGSSLPEGTAAEWFRLCFGTVWGSVLSLGLAVVLLFCGILELRIFSEVVCRFMLPNTPVWVIALVILLVSGAFAAQGMECRGRSAEILFFVVALPLVIILIAVAVSSEYGKVLPLELPDFRGIVQGISAMSIVFQGLLFLYFIFPDLRKPRFSPNAVLKISLMNGFVVALMVFLCLAVYGETVLSEKLLPTLQMMERVSFTGIFLTRQDILLLWFWMASVCIFLSGVLFYGSRLFICQRKQGEEKGKIWLLFWLLAVFLASFLPEDLAAAYRLRQTFLPWLQLIYLFLVPVAFLLVRKRKGGKKNA